MSACPFCQIKGHKMTSMRSKIFLSILAALLLGIMLCGYFFYTATKGNQQVQEITNRAFEATRYSVAFRNSFNEINALSKRVLTMSSFITREEIQAEFQNANSALIKASKGLLKHSLSQKMQVKSQQIQQQKLAWLKDSKLLLGLETSDHIPILEAYKRRQADLENSVNELIVLAKKEASEKLLLSEKKLNDSLLATFVFTLLISVLFAIFAFFLARGLSKPLINLVKTAEQLVTGNTEVTFNQADRSDEIGAVVRAVASFRDGVIDRLSLQENLKLQAEELQEALSKEKELNELQRQFVSMASHEFRTPLAIIDASARRMERRKDRLSSDDIVKRTRKIHNSVQRMLDLIESTLLVAQADNGKLSISPKEINLRDLIEHCCDNQNEIVTTHTITYDIADLPDLFIADAGALTQVMTNLLSNAVKYSPDAPDIFVKGWVAETDIFITVKDHGLGMDEDDVSKLFGRFFRAKTSTGIPGTGIGLNLVKTLIEMHDGEISVQSEQGQGTIFTIQLPLKDEIVDIVDFDEEQTFLIA